MKGLRTLLGTMLALIALPAWAQSDPALDFRVEGWGK